MSKYYHQCQSCNTGFESKRPEAKYCSNGCRQYEYRRNVDFRLWYDEWERIHELSELAKAEENRKKEEETKAKAKAQQEALYKFHTDLMKENFEKLEAYKLEMEIQRADFRLRNWLEGIEYLMLSRKYDSYSARNLFNNILEFKQTSNHKIPINYKYSNFINDILVPYIEEFVENSKGNLIQPDIELLPKEIELKVKATLNELKNSRI